MGFSQFSSEVLTEFLSLEELTAEVVVLQQLSKSVTLVVNHLRSGLSFEKIEVLFIFFSLRKYLVLQQSKLLVHLLNFTSLLIYYVIQVRLLIHLRVTISLILKLVLQLGLGLQKLIVFSFLQRYLQMLILFLHLLNLSSVIFQSFSQFLHLLFQNGCVVFHNVFLLSQFIDLVVFHCFKFNFLIQ